MEIPIGNFYKELSPQILPLCDKTKSDLESVILLYSNFNPDKDARISSFVKLANVFNSLLLTFVFARNSIAEGSWKEAISGEEFTLWIQNFDDFVKIGFIHNISLVIESSFRIFLRALDPNAAVGGMAEFKSIYECLLKSKLAEVPPEGTKLLDFLRLIKNTSHNNGVYFHQSGDNKTVNWKGEVYEFKQGTPVDFVTWDFVLKLSDALRSLLRKVVEDQNLQSIKNEITESFYH